MNQLSRVYIDTQVMASIGDACAQFGKAYKEMLRKEVRECEGDTPICYTLTVTWGRLAADLCVSRLVGADAPCVEGAISAEEEQAIEDRILSHQDILYKELKQFLTGRVRSLQKQKLLTSETLRELLTGYDIVLQRNPTWEHGSGPGTLTRWLWQTLTGRFGERGIVVSIPLVPVGRFRGERI